MLSTWHRWKAPEVQNVLSPGCSLFLLTVSKTVFFHRGVMYISRKTRPTPFFVVGRPRSHSQRPPQGRTIAAPVSFMISARPPGKATVRTTDIQVFGMCFSPILGDGLVTSGESLKRYMACAEPPFPGRSLGDRCRRPPGHRPGQPSRKYSRDVRAPVPWGGGQNGPGH